MKYSMVIKDDEKSKKIADNIKENIKIEYDEQNPDFVITVGGDGTFLKALHQYEHIQDKAIFFIVNTGHLGFFSNFDDKELQMLEAKINTNKFDIAEYTLLDYEIVTESGVAKGTALNEVTIINPTRTLMLDVFLDELQLEHFRGTGLCVSTPAGSTAYNRSLGGAIVDSSLDAFQVTEIASINSKVFNTLSSPLVLSKNHKVEFKAALNTTIWITVDSKSLNIDNFKSLKVTLSNKKIKYCKNGVSFINRLKKNFL